MREKRKVFVSKCLLYEDVTKIYFIVSQREFQLHRTNSISVDQVTGNLLFFMLLENKHVFPSHKFLMAKGIC